MYRKLQNQQELKMEEKYIKYKISQNDINSRLTSNILLYSENKDSKIKNVITKYPIETRPTTILLPTSSIH